LDELNAMLAALVKVPSVAPTLQPSVVRLDDDWLTKGDCLGRYGRYWSVFCAICGPKNYLWGAGPETVSYSARTGPNHDQDDLLRHCIQWLYTQNPNSLEMPPVYYSSRVMKGYAKEGFTRCQASWDDHGDAYPMAKDGPDILCTLKIPAGLYYLSLYEFNQDGHGGSKRYRDFTLSVRPHQGAGFFDISTLKMQPELARGRIHDFWGGVWKRFLVRGPTEITIEVDRNHAYSTILTGVFLDLVDEEPLPYFHDLKEWKAISKQQAVDREALRTQSQTDRAARFRPRPSVTEASSQFFDELEKTRITNAAWWATEGRRLYVPILRSALAAQKADPAGPEKQRLLARAATCYYQLGLFAPWEADEVALGKTPARQIEKALKWDNVNSFAGKGYKTVVDYLQVHRRADTAKADSPGASAASGT
jgi:hypothetical protein